MTESVLVTGGGGFIGHHLVRRLLADGHDVHVLVRYSNPVRYPRLAKIWDKIVIHEGDLRNFGSLKNAFEGVAFDKCFHLAAYNHVGQSWKQWEECYDTNAKGTANLLNALGEDVRFVYTSSSEVYGKQTKIPWAEYMLPNPVSPYAVTKLAGEHQAKAMSGFNTVTIRPFNTYGPWQSTKAVIPDIIVRLLRGQTINMTPGEQTREFNYVDDIVDGMIHIGFHGPRMGPFNLCSGVETKICDLSGKLLTLCDNGDIKRDLSYRQNEIWRMAGCAFGTKALFGWQTKIPLNEGLKQTVEWYRKALAEGIAL